MRLWVHTMNRLFLGLLSILCISSCATDSQFEAETSSPETHHVRGLGNHNVMVGVFKDSRKLPPNFLGLITSANPGAERQKIETSQPVAEIVTAGFGAGLKVRDMQAQKKKAEWTITGEILEFSCNQASRAGATVDIRVRLFRAGSTTASFNKSFTSEKTAAVAAGNNEALKGLAATALEDAVNRALDDSELRQILQEN
jgi:hypothetical protein